MVVLETGLGGALDATNVITTTLLEVIASISMDHMEFLGDTLEKIAVQKAGIIKPHTQVVCAAQKEEAQKVIEETCKRQHCCLRTVKQEHFPGRKLSGGEWRSGAGGCGGFAGNRLPSF